MGTLCSFSSLHPLRKGYGRHWDFWVDEPVPCLPFPRSPIFSFYPSTFLYVFLLPILPSFHPWHPYPYQFPTLESMIYAQMWEGAHLWTIFLFCDLRGNLVTALRIVMGVPLREWTSRSTRTPYHDCQISVVEGIQFRVKIHNFCKIICTFTAVSYHYVLNIIHELMKSFGTWKFHIRYKTF